VVVKNETMQRVLDQRPTQDTQANKKEVLTEGEAFAASECDQADDKCRIKVDGR
jgi:hypothetical protein